MSDVLTKKQCKGCGEWKDRSEFNKHPQTADRLWAKCRVCTKKMSAVYRRKNADKILKKREMNREKNRLYAAEYRAKNPEKIKQSKAAYCKTPRGREFCRLASKKYHEEHTLARQAHSSVEYAVRTGKLIRPKKCGACNTEGPVEGHHEDYNKPLDVQWMCDRCHKKRTKEIHEMKKRLTSEK